MEYQKPLQIHAYDSLKEMILNEELVHGMIYSETRMSKELGISRTPLRDAIQRLAQEKYIDVIPSKGFRLHEMNEQDLLDTYQVRCALEGFCIVQLAREHDTPEGKRTIKALESLVRDQESIIGTTDSIEDFAAYDQEFHKRIISFVNNATLDSLHQVYLHQILKQTLISLQAAGRMQDTVEEHRQIVKAVSVGSVESSYMAALYHLEKPKQIIGSHRMQQ